MCYHEFFHKGKIMGNSVYSSTNLDTSKAIIFTQKPVYAFKSIIQLEGKAADESASRVHPIQPGQGIIYENRQGIKSYLIATAYDTPDNSFMLREARPDEIKKMNELMQKGPEKSIFERIFGENQPTNTTLANSAQTANNPLEMLQAINASITSEASNTTRKI